MARLKVSLRCIVSTAIILIVVRKVNWTQLASVLQSLNFHLAVPASLLTLLLISLLAYRWRIFLSEQNIELPFGTILSLTWAGQFFNSVLPGSTGDDVVKIFQLCRLAPDRKAAAAASVLVDRLSAFIALAILVAVGLVMDPVPLMEISLVTRSIKGAVLVCAIAAVVVGIGTLIVFRIVRSGLWLGRLRRTLGALQDNLRFSRHLATAMLIAFSVHCLSFFIVFLFARSLGIGITYFQCLLVMPVVLFLVMLPITVNGHGLREVILILYFQHLHITLPATTSVGVRESVIALSLVLVSNDLLWSLPGGLWYLMHFKRDSA